MIKKKEKYLIIGLTEIGLAIGPPPRRDVLLELELPEELIGLADGLGLMAALAPPEARELAQRLARKADEAEAS